MARVAICTPSYDEVEKINTGVSIYNMDNAGHDTFRLSKSGYGVEKGRDECVKAALKENADWILFIDSDIMVFDDTLEMLMSHDVDVCLGWYRRQKAKNGETCLYPSWQPGFSICYKEDDLYELASNGERLIEVKGGGMGCALIRAGVFDVVKYPWFNYIPYEDGSRLSEDLSFCLTCRSLGIKVYADPRVGCGHALKDWAVPKRGQEKKQ